MAELALSVQEQYHLSTEVLDHLFRCLLTEYETGAKKNGLVLYEQSDRGLETKNYQQRSHSNEFRTLNYILIGLELSHQGIISSDGFSRLVDAHYAEEELHLNDIPELVERLREELDVDFEEVINENESLMSFLDEIDGPLNDIGLIPEDFTHFWNDFILFAQRVLLRLTLTSLDCVGEGFHYGHTTYFTSYKLHDLYETLMDRHISIETHTEEEDVRGRKFARQLNYESRDWDYITFRANAVRGGGFSCFS